MSRLKAIAKANITRLRGFSGNPNEYLNGEGEFTVPAGGSDTPSFEKVSKNLKSWDVVSSTTNSLTYSDGVESITKTITKPTSDTVVLTLSGDTPSGIDLIKTITIYDNGDLPTWVYS